MSASITTGEVRLSYPHLFTPHKSEMEDVPSYSAELLIPKSDEATMNAIRNAIQETINESKDRVWGGQVPAQFKNPIIRDGDASNDERHKGHWLITVRNKLKEGVNVQPPKVVGMDRQPIIDQSEIYGGVYAYVNINFFLYNFKGTKGIGCGFDAGVMKSRDGEPFGRVRTSIDDAFGSIPAPAASVPSGAAIDPLTGQPQVAINPLTGKPY